MFFCFCVILVAYLGHGIFFHPVALLVFHPQICFGRSVKLLKWGKPQIKSGARLYRGTRQGDFVQV